MDILKNIQDTVTLLGDKAKKTFDTTKLEIKIKNYSNEMKELFLKIGILVYESNIKNKEIDINRLNELIANINNIKFRVSNLEKQIDSIKNNSAEKLKETKIAEENKNYLKMNMKHDDFRIIRTEEGIKMLRFCPECNYGNHQSSEICKNCGYTWSI